MSMGVLESYYRIPDGVVPRQPAGGAPAACVADTVKGIKAHYAARRGTGEGAAAPADSPAELSKVLDPAFAQTCSLDALVDDLRLERYYTRDLPPERLLSSAIKSIYYLVRPLLPVPVRKHLQRSWLKGWQDIPFPGWPVDTTVDAMLTLAVANLLKQNGGAIPFVWFWPDGHDACAIMTHDVETAAGRDFCGRVMDLEEPFGIASSFEVVPEQRYAVPASYLSTIRERGCEICVHDLNHDGKLFSREGLFVERAKKINDYATAFGAIGFRSAVMYRNVDWFKHFTFKYDMSMPNVAHLDPQRGGCCTVMPYAIGNLLELPLTTIQDYPLFHNLERYDTSLWTQQIDILLKQHGLISFIVHPDYIVSPAPQDVYTRLLAMLAQLRDAHGVWLPLPRDVYAWWTQRSRMRLVADNGSWRIEGEGRERASIAWLRLDHDRLVYDR